MVYIASCTRILDLADNHMFIETEEILSDQRKFFHHISTELRQPLNSIMGRVGGTFHRYFAVKTPFN
jgi:signal transduction histidine kinase